MHDVVGLGENSIDYVYRLPVYPRPNGPLSKVQIAAAQVLAGGQVATTLATCASLGLRTKYVGVFGNDANGQRIRGELARRGVDVADAIVRQCPNRYAVILVDETHGERVVLWDRDVRLDLRDDEVSVDTLATTRVLHVDDVDEAASIAAATVAREAGVTVTSDIDRVTERTPELIEAVTIAILSEHIPQALTGEPTTERALRRLRQRHRAWLCATLGDRGSMLLVDDELYRAPAVAIDVVDTTGAGDVFRGAFIYAWLRREGPERILRFANAAAALSCSQEGAMDSIPSLADVESLAASP